MLMVCIMTQNIFLSKPLLRRADRMAMKSLQIISTVSRMEHRRRIGMTGDRRPDTSFRAPPTNLVLCD
jgi:hypothetical protein